MAVRFRSRSSSGTRWRFRSGAKCSDGFTRACVHPYVRLTGVGRRVPREVLVVYRIPRVTASSRNAAKQPGVA
eukprot:6938699-Prymnesium_polylepis.1